MAYSEKEYQKRLSFAQARNALITLIAINLVLFVILAFVKALFLLRYAEHDLAIQHFHQSVLDWFSLSASPGKIAGRPWTIFTHMFVQDDVWQILGNMLWLWVFGYILQDLTGNRKIIPVFLYGAFAGAIGFVLAYNIWPSLRPQLAGASFLGASAGIMAIAAAVTTISPKYRIFPMLNGGIPIWILTLIYFIIDLATIPLSTPGQHVADIAGALAGVLFIVAFRKGHDLGGWINQLFDWVGNLFNPERPRKGRNIRQELFYKADTNPFKKTPNVTPQRVDEILDKISQRGYHSLTDEEKELLKRASKEDI